jgi:hypothetical protein
MAEHLVGGPAGVRAFCDALAAPELPAPSEPDPEPEWEDWGADPEAQARMEAAMAMMGGSAE